MIRSLPLPIARDHPVILVPMHASNNLRIPDSNGFMGDWDATARALGCLAPRRFQVTACQCKCQLDNTGMPAVTFA